MRDQPARRSGHGFVGVARPLCFHPGEIFCGNGAPLRTFPNCINGGKRNICVQAVRIACLPDPCAA
jgi:hypothetical protein